MVDVSADFSCAYDDFGIDATVNGTSVPIRVIVDNDLDMDDSGMTFIRALKDTTIARGDTVLLMGNTYKVVRVYTHGDQNEENIAALNEVT